MNLEIPTDERINGMSLPQLRAAIARILEYAAEWGMDEYDLDGEDARIMRRYLEAAAKLEQAEINRMKREYK